LDRRASGAHQTDMPVNTNHRRPHQDGLALAQIADGDRPLPGFGGA
jgi:hypothetical protein